MVNGYAEVAMEIIKIGGAVILGYALNKGKAAILEKQHKEEEIDLQL